MAGREPQRTCIACRETRDQSQLVRYVLAPDGRLLVDYRHKLPGRGAYTCVSAECLQRAVARKQFQRSFRGLRQAVSERDLQAALVQELSQRISNLVGMARKSQQAISGSNAVMEGLRQQGGYALVLIAEDISAGIAEKIMELSERHEVPCFQLFSKGRLGQILGKGERSVIAVPAGALADTLLKELQRYKQMLREN